VTQVDLARCLQLLSAMNWAHAALWRVLIRTGMTMSVLIMWCAAGSMVVLLGGIFSISESVKPAGIVACIIVLAFLGTSFFRGHAVFGIGPAPSFPECCSQAKEDKLLRHLRFVAISDTHSNHRGIPHVPDGDVLIHAGDFAIYADDAEISDFNDWLGTLPHKHKVVIAGNHDFTFDRKWGDLPSNRAFWEWGVGKSWNEQCDKVEKLLTNCTYLCHEQIDIEGCTIYATPAQPPLAGVWWAFTEDDAGLIERFSKIPEGIDVLLTHTPPYGQGDRTLNGVRYGCQHLMAAVKRAKPRFHVFGHIHDGYGVTQEDGTTFVNAATTTSLYHPYHAPVVFDVPVRAAAEEAPEVGGMPWRSCCVSGKGSVNAQRYGY